MFSFIPFLNNLFSYVVFLCFFTFFSSFLLHLLMYQSIPSHYILLPSAHLQCFIPFLSIPFIYIPFPFLLYIYIVSVHAVSFIVHSLHSCPLCSFIYVWFLSFYRTNLLFPPLHYLCSVYLHSDLFLYTFLLPVLSHSGSFCFDPSHSVPVIYISFYWFLFLFCSFTLWFKVLFLYILYPSFLLFLYMLFFIVLLFMFFFTFRFFFILFLHVFFLYATFLNIFFYASLFNIFFFPILFLYILLCFCIF